MKKLLALICALPAFLFSQTISPTQFFDSTYDISGENLISGFDSSMIVSGAINTFPASFYIHKVDMDGNLIAEKSFDAYTADMYFPSKLIRTKDSAYMSVHTIVQSSFNKMIVTKWDQNLDTLWQKVYDFGADVKIGGITQAFDSSTYISVSDNQDIFLSKLNFQGDLVWTKTLDYTANVTYSDFCETADSNICIVSTILGNASYISIIDTSGAELNSKEITDHSTKEILCDIDGNFFLLGQSTSSGVTGVLKLDNALDLVSAKSLGYIEGLENSDFKFLNDSTIMASGSYSWQQFSGTLYLIDTDLNYLENVNFFGEFKSMCGKYGEPYFIEQGPLYGLKAQIMMRHYSISAFHDDSLSCNDYYQHNVLTTTASLTNTSATISNGNAQLVPIQLPLNTPSFGTDQSCISFFGSLDENEESELLIFPNPSKGRISIESILGKNINQIQIHSTDGRLIYTSKNIKNSKTTLNLSHLPAGIYYLKAEIGDGFVNEKIVIE